MQEMILDKQNKGMLQLKHNNKANVNLTHSGIFTCHTKQPHSNTVITHKKKKKKIKNNKLKQINPS
jgi:hypothetical protein